MKKFFLYCFAKKNVQICLPIFILGILFLCTPLINHISYILGSFSLMILAFLSYFLLSKIERNYASLCGLLSLVWFGTIGLSNLKIMDYQRIWAIKTWLIYAVAYIIICCVIRLTNNIRWEKAEQKLNFLDIKNVNVKCLVIATSVLFCLASAGFLLTAKICGFIPFFVSDKMNSYLDFYTKFLLLSHFAIINIPLSYFTLKKVKNLFLKTILIFYIFIQVFIIPILSVNRGIFMIGALMLSIVIFFLENKKMIILILCLIVSFMGFEIGSIGRNYTTEMLKKSFQQAETTISNGATSPENDDTSAEKSDNSSTNNSTNDNINENYKMSINEHGDYFIKKDNIIVVKNTGESLSKIPDIIPAKILFLYSYLTVSHDNLDLAIKYNETFNYGARQLKGFNFITNKFYKNQNDYVHFRVQANLTTDNLLGTSYYDFGIVGVIMFSLLFGFFCGFSESLYKFSKSYISLIFLSIMSYCILLSFFSNYTSQFIFILNIVSLIFIFIIIKILDKILYRC